MSVTADVLERLEVLLSPPEAGAPSAADLRRDFAGLSVAYCDVLDVRDEQPYRQYPRFHLYLLDGSAHCWQLTTDPARATGVMLARLA